MPNRVVVFSQPSCTPCDQVQAFLTERGVDFETRDVSVDPKALDELATLGYLATPVTVIDGEAVAGFNRKRLETLLQKQT